MLYLQVSERWEGSTRDLMWPAMLPPGGIRSFTLEPFPPRFRHGGAKALLGAFSWHSGEVGNANSREANITLLVQTAADRIIREAEKSQVSLGL